MAPINLPNGNEVSEIVLPNGATASEVIAPDGSTVFGGITDGPVDDYEDQDLSEYAGDTSAASIVSSAALEGSYSLQYEQDSGVLLYSTSGLDLYPQQGQNFACLCEADNGNGAAVCYGLEDTNNFFAVSVEVAANKLRFFETSGGNLDATQLATPTLSGDTIYDVDIVWNFDDSHDITLYTWDTSNFERGSAIASGSVTSTAATGTGIGFRGGGSQRRAIYDYYRIIGGA
jgi:hypothetical protein